MKMDGMIRRQAAGLFPLVRETVPLVHCITNYVTVNDVANAVLAIGASPIMADDIGEAAQITSMARAVVLNIGTLNARTVESMVASGREANRLGIPVVFDPVGAGASELRNRTVDRILQEVRLTVLRGNLSEASYVAGLGASTKGVDSAAADEKNDPESVAAAVARRLGCVAAVTGAVDTITDGSRMVRIHNGHPMLSRVTGTGCMTSALVGAFVGTGEDPLAAAAAGVSAMGIAGETAFQRAGAAGTGSFHIAVIDAISGLDRDSFQNAAKWEEKAL